MVTARTATKKAKGTTKTVGARSTFASAANKKRGPLPTLSAGIGGRIYRGTSKKIIVRKYLREAMMKASLRDKVWPPYELMSGFNAFVNAMPDELFEHSIVTDDEEEAHMHKLYGKPSKAAKHAKA
jgi:hypothetical protein